jgi:hypothetical protein
MIFLSFNCRGLGNLIETLALKRLVESQNLDIMLLQESLGEGGKLVSKLGKLFGGWEFIYVDNRGKSIHL